MRLLLLSAATTLTLAAGLFAPAHAEDLGYGLWDNGYVGTSSYRQATFYKTIDGSDAYAEMTGTITTTWNLQELSASGSHYRYWKLHVDTQIDPSETEREYTVANDDLWTRVSVWPVGATKLQRWTTESKELRRKRGGCTTASLGVSQGLGPLNASWTLASWEFCNNVMLESESNPQDVWRQHYVVRDFDKAEDYGVVYILKTPRHQMPRFHIDVDMPKDTGSGYDVVSRIGGYSKVTPRTGRY